MPTLSIIVPVYNVEPYLARSLDSILNQGFDEGFYEVLLINDGSTDSSLSICERYQGLYPHIFRVLSKINEGVAATRNLGIDQARGEWIYFMDGDDYLVPGGLSSVVSRYLDDSIDMLSFSSITLNETEHLRRRKLLPLNYDFSTSRIIYEGRDRLIKMGLNVFVWNTIFKKQFLNTWGGGIRFKSLRIAEDVLFKLECALYRGQERIVNDCIYHYITRNSSAVSTRTESLMKEYTSCYEILFDRIKEAIEENQGDGDLKRSLKHVLTGQLTPYISRVLSANLSLSELRCSLKKTKTAVQMADDSRVKKLLTMIHLVPITYPIVSIIYRRLFIPFVYPLISKN